MNIYLVPASQENIDVSIRRPVDISVADRSLSAGDAVHLKRLLQGEQGFHCWALTESGGTLFTSMQQGDEVLFTVKDSGQFGFLGEIYWKVESERLGREVWTFVPGKPWSLIYFLRNIDVISVPKPFVLEAIGYSPKDKVQRARAVRSDLLMLFLQRHGSLREFLISGHGRGSRPMSVQRQPPAAPSYVRPALLVPVIDRVGTLKREPSHQERAHEALVEEFYEAIGYKKVSEIKYQQGRIDLAIQIGADVRIVNEVKRDWNLSRHDRKALKQAYGYALETGARFVVLTNGDFYAVFDRHKGLSFDDNFVREFRLTELESEDLTTIRSLGKTHRMDL